MLTLNSSKIGLILKKYRENAGNSLRVVEKLTNINRSLIYRFEEGSRRPSLATLLKLGRNYSMTRDQLIELIDLYGYRIPLFTDSYNVKEGKEVKVTKMDKKATDQSTGMNFNIDPTRTPVLYADSIYIKSNENGVGLDFAQQIGPSNQFNIVARIGLSKDHARKLIEQLEGLLRADGTSSTQKKLN